MRFHLDVLVAAAGAMSMVLVYAQECPGDAKCGSITGGLEFAVKPIDPARVVCIFGVAADFQSVSESCCGEQIEYDCFCISESMAQENLSPSIRTSFCIGIIACCFFLLVFAVHVCRYKEHLRQMAELHPVYYRKFDIGYCTLFFYLASGTAAWISFREWNRLRTEGFWLGCGSFLDIIPLGT